MREEKKLYAMDGGKSESASSTGETREPTRGTSSREDALRATEPLEGKAAAQQPPQNVSTKLERVAKRARERPKEAFTNLSYLIDVDWLKEAYARTRKDGARGVDGVSAQEYEANLDENLASLLERFKSGMYRAPPVRRVHIPKGDGSKTRPIGIPTFEDKVLQRAVTMVLNAIYEEEFRNCSFGFRSGRSQHQALEALRQGAMRMNGGVVIEIDIQSFFDTLDHAHLRSFLDLRVRDGVIRRAIGKWLNAGVLEDECLKRSDEGTPQGGVISPLLANIFLHYVLDVWLEDEIRSRLSGEALLVRYADDAVIVVDNEEDARRVMAVLPKRFEKYGLTLHPEKTRLVRFKRPRRDSEVTGSDDDDETPGTFSFLGLTHYWGLTREGTAWVIKRKTEAKRLKRSLKAIAAFCKAARHWRIADQHARLCKMLSGHDNYYGLPCNSPALWSLRYWATRIWQKWLNRRSQKRDMPWDRFAELLRRFPLPPARLIPRTRLAARP